MNLTATSLAIAFLVIAVVRMIRHGWRATRLDVVMMLLAGFGLVGAGAVGDLLATGGAKIGELLSTGTSQALGAGFPALVVIAMATVIIIDLRDRNIWKPTPWLALALPTTAQVVGGIGVGAGITVLSWLSDLGNGLLGFISNL